MNEPFMLRIRARVLLCSCVCVVSHSKRQFMRHCHAMHGHDQICDLRRFFLCAVLPGKCINATCTLTHLCHQHGQHASTGHLCVHIHGGHKMRAYAHGWTHLCVCVERVLLLVHIFYSMDPCAVAAAGDHLKVIAAVTRRSRPACETIKFCM